MPKNKKFEPRNSKFETISNGENSKLKTVCVINRTSKKFLDGFGHLKLGIVSDFDIRISDLEVQLTP